MLNHRHEAWDFQTAACRAGELASLTDEQLILLLQATAEDRVLDDLFHEFFSRYHPRVLNWCARIVRDPERGYDLAQDIFLRAFRYRHSFRGQARVSTWLYSITRNHCLNAIRRFESDPLRASGSLPPELPDQGGDVHAEIERAQTFERMWQVIGETLTETERRVMALHYGHELRLETITRELMLSNPSGAKAHIVNARRKLKRVLSELPSNGQHMPAA